MGLGTRDAWFDASLRRALHLLVDHDPGLLEPPPDYSHRVTAETLAGHVRDMVAAADGRARGSLTLAALSRSSSRGTATARAIVGRHPLLPLLLPVRAAVELADGVNGAPHIGVIKLFAGTKTTTTMQRGVHRPRRGAASGRQLHLELIVVTTTGRPVLVATERFSEGDVTWDERWAAGSAAMEAARVAGIRAIHLRLEQRTAAMNRIVHETWGPHWGDPPHDAMQHVTALAAAATAGAALAGREDIYAGLPLVGGQLIAATPAGTLPAEPSVALVGHDLAAVKRLLDHGFRPVLDLNLPSARHPWAIEELPFAVRFAGRGGGGAHTGTGLVAALSDSALATVVPRAEMGIPETVALSVTYRDGEVDMHLPAGPVPARVYLRSGFGPHNLYLSPMTPGDPAAHARALAAVVADSTTLHTPRSGPIAAARAACERTGAFDPGGEGARIADGLGAIGRLAADRELHRAHGAGALVRD